MLSLHLLQVSLVYVNTLMIQQVLTEPSGAAGGSASPVAAQVAARESVRDLHPKYARTAASGSVEAALARPSVEILAFARLRPK